MPHFTLAPERWGHRLISAFGYQDIDFDEHPEFSRAFILRGDNEERTRALFDDELIHFMQGNSGNTVEGATDWVVIYRPRKREKPDALSAFMELGFLIASNVSLAAMRGGMSSSGQTALRDELFGTTSNPDFSDRS